MTDWKDAKKAKNKRAKPFSLDEDRKVYVDTGDKLNYAMCWKQDDGSLKFMSWIRKYCVKDTDTVVKKKKEEIGG